MVTSSELLRVVLVPVIVSAVIAAVGRWRGWAWAMPLAAGAGFLAGYAMLGVPRLPPRDGTDWLFWLAVPVTLLGVLDAYAGRRWGWLLGAAAGGVVLVIGWPLTPEAVAPAELYRTAALVGVAGAVVCFAVSFAEPRIGPAAAVAALCVTLGGAAVVVVSSNLRVVGVYGIAAAAALGPVAVLAGKLNAGRSVAVVAVCLLAGLLAGGHYYPDPGVTSRHFALMTIAPVFMLAGAIIPERKRTWIRGLVAVLAVAITVGAVTLPVALDAKKAAEQTSQDDPYAGY